MFKFTIPRDKGKFLKEQLVKLGDSRSQIKRFQNKEMSMIILDEWTN